MRDIYQELYNSYINLLLKKYIYLTFKFIIIGVSMYIGLDAKLIFLN